MIKSILIIFLALLLAVGCKAGSKTDTSTPKADTTWATFNGSTMWWVYSDSVSISMNEEAKGFFQNWTADSSVFEFRRPYIKFFTDRNNGSKFLTGLKRVDIIRYMGKPDHQNTGEGFITTVLYNMESGCGNPEYDCCWLTIYFDDRDKVKEVSVGCT